MTTDYYGKNAYRSTQIPSLTEGSQPAFPFSFSREQGDALERVPYKIFKSTTPKQLREFEQKGYPKGQEWRKNERYGALNQRCIRPLSLSGDSNFSLMAESVCKFLTLMLLVVNIFMIVGTLVYDGIYGAIDSFYFALCVEAFFSIGWLIFHLLNKYNPIQPGIGSPWELNRQTGMVSLYQYDETNPEAQPQIKTAPFHEMKAEISNSFDRYGARHLLLLNHRYSDLSIPVGLLIGTQSDIQYCDDLWDFIQNYMDVTKPLPDIPLFEEYRHLDPTTKAHDEQVNRPIRYWRDMNNTEWRNQCIKARSFRANTPSP